MKLGCEATPTNRSVPAKQGSKMLYFFCNLGLHLGLIFTAIITSTFIRIVTRKLRMFRIIRMSIAVTAKAIFSTLYSCFQTISFPVASDSVTFDGEFFFEVVFVLSYRGLPERSAICEFGVCVKIFSNTLKLQ